MADLDLHLYRSLQTKSLGKGKQATRNQRFLDADGAESLYPLYEGYQTKNGFRAPDVTTIDKKGETFIKGVGDKSREGVSLNSSPGGFGYSGWAYFILPEGTAIPAGLDVHPSPTRRFKDHYSLRCRNEMTKDAYQGALDTLARAAIAKAVELGISPLKFSA